MARSVRAIAVEIHRDWPKPHFGAWPYLEAMFSLNSMQDKYLYDDAFSVVAYFLANASSWRGETARRVKKELNSMLKEVQRG